MGLKTALHNIHESEKARLVDFAGWDMPLQYESITAEHKAVRESAGIFDVSHMGRFFITGAGALANIQRVVVSDISKLNPGQTKYSVVCNEQGGAKDDVLVTRLAEDRFLMVVNASNREKLLDWFKQHFSGSHDFQDKTLESGMIAIQGPNALAIINKIMNGSFDNLDYYFMKELSDGVLISRTGYTGEDGFEIISNADHIRQLWQQARDAGATPTGLGCRDSLRLEMGMALYGHELEENITPLEAGLQWVVDLDKDAFIGKDALQKQKQDGIPRRKIGFVLDGKGVPRQGYKLLDNGKEVGEVTSGTVSPTLAQGIGLGMVKSGHTKSNALSVEIRGRQIPVVVTKPPFVKNRTGKV